MFRTALLILSGNGFGSFLLLLRNLAVARLISVEDYGIAATFAISMAIVEMMSSFGFQQLIVQDASGDDPKFQADLQGFNLLRGIFAGISLFLLAAPIANFLGVPQIAWAYKLLALAPVIKGFGHFDAHRMNRNMQFAPLMLIKIIPAVISLLCLWPLYYVFKDYRVMLFSLIIQWILGLVLSHLLAERPFRVSFSGPNMRKSFAFGWPILVNNMFLFIIFQGDRLLVGRELGMEALALFSMGITLTLSPTLVSSASEQQYFLPQLSSATGDSDLFQKIALAAMQTSLLSGLLLVIFVSALATPLVHFLLGFKYWDLAPILPWLAIWQAMRAFKVGNTTVALSRALTTNAMIANGVRILAIPLSWWVLLQGGTVLHIVWIATTAELCAYIVSLLLITYRLNIHAASIALPFLTSLITLATAALYNSYLPEGTQWNVFGLFAMLCSFLLCFVSMRELRSYIKVNKFNSL